MTLVTMRAAQSKILKVWNNIDKRINKYHVEAADNAKFLGAIEKTSHSIYLEDPAQMKESLMRVIHIVKMIYNVSHHYNTPERVASLLVKITNQVYRLSELMINLIFAFEQLHIDVIVHHPQIYSYIYRLFEHASGT